MSTPLFIFTASLPFATILLVFGMRYFALIQQARTRWANDEAYRALAETAAADQAVAAAALAAIEARLAAIEKVLRDVG